MAVRHPIAKIKHTKIDLKTGDMLDNDISLIGTVPNHPLLLLDVADSIGLNENDSSRPHTSAVRPVHASTVRTKAADLS